jgi:toxin-antitoxin system PIN domain toxin
MARVALLDVNVLVALFFPDHVHHDLAHDWFASEAAGGWATCPMTENGFVRVASRLPSESGPWRPSEVASRLQRLCAADAHRFWPDQISLLDDSLFNRDLVRGAAQVTDVYLLGLAKKMGGCLATFDRTIPLGAVVGATRAHLAVIRPSDD